jgi:ADP-ribosylglycohydrolase
MSIARDVEDAALGTFLGACIGDAAGATLEFRGLPAPDDVERAMAMSGGGFFRLASGQITDDGELALSLADALSRSSSFDIETIARAYARWVDSGPFDIGTTTRLSLAGFREPSWRQTFEKEGYASAMKAAASRYCGASKANGSLMRIAPLALWGHRLSDDDLARCAMEDSLLSHPNASCRHALACYVIAVANLLRQPGERGPAFARAIAWAERNANQEVRLWLREAVERTPVDFLSQVGFIRIAFVNAFQHLLQESSYERTIRDTLQKGGDTDTNACIAGALVGAAVGAGSIPEPMKAAVLGCDTRQGRPRPEFLHGRRVPELTKALLSAAEWSPR